MAPIRSAPADQGSGPPPAWHPSAVALLVFDADTIAGADGSNVSAWSSTGSNTSLQAVQATGTNQPVLVKNAQGGKAIVRFNSAIVANFMQVASVPLSSTTGIAFIGLAKPTSGYNWPMLMVYQQGSANGYNWEVRGYSTNTTWDFGAPDGTHIGSNTGAIDNLYHIFGGIKLSTNMMYLYTDAVQESSYSETYSTLNNYSFTIGQRPPSQGPSNLFPFSGDVACAILVSGDLADADRQKIEGWLANKWSLQSLLPAGHPYKSSPP